MGLDLGSTKKAPAGVALQMRLVSIDALRFNERNSRTHSDEQIAQLVASIREFGFTIPVLIDEDGLLIAGEGRSRAARIVGLTEVPALDAIGWTEEQKRAYAIADNKIAANAGWNDDILRTEMIALRDVGIDLASMGFTGDELTALLNPPIGGGTDPDYVPPTPATPISSAGDLWLLGPHRVLCGDATIAANVQQLLDGATPAVMVTDPPYGVKYDPSWRARAGIGSANSAQGKVLNDDRFDWREAWALFPGNVAYVWHGALFGAQVQASLEAVKFGIRAQIVWVKSRPTLSRGHYHWQHEAACYAVREGADDGWRFVEEHEAAFYAVRDGKSANWRGGRKQSTCWFIDHLRNDTGHGTQKPVDCMKRPIENNAAPGAAVYDPFLGSGTTVIAAAMTGRVAYGLELDPCYVDVIVDRWQKFSGGVARRARDGRSFDEIKRDASALAERSSSQRHEQEAGPESIGAASACS